jgi:hypothetical protein
VTPLALGIAAYAVAFLIFPDAGGDLRADRMARMPIALIAHVGGSLLALAIGPFQLHKGLRSRMLDLHRLMGRAYLLAVLVGGLGGLWLRRIPMAGWSRTWASGRSPCCGSGRRRWRSSGFACAISCRTGSG